MPTYITHTLQTSKYTGLILTKACQQIALTFKPLCVMLFIHLYIYNIQDASQPTAARSVQWGQFRPVCARSL